jgi:hypothetical protein
MRTKALLGLAALAVSAATCVAQNVYSLNIVGYVNVDVKTGLNLISVPLKPSDGNKNITNTIVLPDTAENSEIYKWTGTGWSTDIPTWIAGFGWFSAQPVTMELGEAFFLKSTVDTKVTFVGEVETGDAIPYTMKPGINVVANKVPVEESWPGKTGTVVNGKEGDNIYTWTPGGNAWSSPWSYITDYGWFGPGTADPVEGPVLKVGSGVVYQVASPTANTTWTRSFTP